MKRQQDGEKVEVKTFSVIYLILLSHFSFPIASLLHFACQPRSLKYIYLCQSKLNFHLSLHCLTPLFPPPCLHSSIPSLPPAFPSFHHLSLPSKQGITLTHPTVDIPLLLQKRKYKTAIFRFMCHIQKKYNHEYVGKGGVSLVRDRG